VKKIISIVILCLWVSFLYAQNNRPRSRNDVIYLLNYIATEACLTEQYKEDSLLLEEIYKRLENKVDPGWIDADSKKQILNNFNAITDFRIQDLSRQQIHYMRDYAKARAIRSAIPSPVFFLSLTNNIKNPLALIVNIAGMAAQSVSSYLSATEQAEMQLHEKSIEIKKEQLGSLNNLTSSMWGYRQTTATANKLSDNDTVSPQNIRNFLKYKKDAPALRFENLKSREIRHIYEKYYPYWLELANTAHELGKYWECISAIERYEAIRSPLFMAYSDTEYSLTLCKGIDSLAHIYKNNPGVYITRCLEYLKKIEQNVPVDEWSIRFTAALAYMDLASVTSNASDKTTYLNSAYRLYRGNLVNNLAARQIEMIEKYMKPIETPKNATPEQKKVYDELKKKREKELFPVDEAFYANYHAVIGLMEQLKMSQQERNTLNTALGDALMLIKARDEYCRSTEENYNFLKNCSGGYLTATKEEKAFMDSHKKKNLYYNPFNPLSKWDDYFVFPFLFLSSNAKLNIEASFFVPKTKEETLGFPTPAYLEENVKWEAYLVERKPKSNVDSWEVSCNISLESKMKKADVRDPDYIDFIISDPVGVYRLRHIFTLGPHYLFYVVKEQ